MLSSPSRRHFESFTRGNESQLLKAQIMESDLIQMRLAYKERLKAGDKARKYTVGKGPITVKDGLRAVAEKKARQAKGTGTSRGRGRGTSAGRGRGRGRGSCTGTGTGTSTGTGTGTGTSTGTGTGTGKGKEKAQVEARTSLYLDIESNSDDDDDDSDDSDDLGAYGEVDEEEFLTQNPELVGFQFGDTVIDPFLENDNFVALG
jgi:hypothetical protein